MKNQESDYCQQWNSAKTNEGKQRYPYYRHDTQFLQYAWLGEDELRIFDIKSGKVIFEINKSEEIDFYSEFNLVEPLKWRGNLGRKLTEVDHWQIDRTGRYLLAPSEKNISYSLDNDENIMIRIGYINLLSSERGVWDIAISNEILRKCTSGSFSTGRMEMYGDEIVFYRECPGDDYLLLYNIRSDSTSQYTIPDPRTVEMVEQVSGIDTHNPQFWSRYGINYDFENRILVSVQYPVAPYAGAWIEHTLRHQSAYAIAAPETLRRNRSFSNTCKLIPFLPRTAFSSLFRIEPLVEYGSPKRLRNKASRSFTSFFSNNSLRSCSLYGAVNQV